MAARVERGYFVGCWIMRHLYQISWSWDLDGESWSIKKSAATKSFDNGKGVLENLPRVTFYAG